MTLPRTAAPRAAAAPTDRHHLARIARRLADPALGPGALASVRRGDPASVSRQPTCHRLLREVEDRALAGDGALRWATAVLVLALLARPGAPSGGRPAGQALAAAGLPESRLARLLASHDDALRDQLVLAARFLRSRDEACTPLDLAELALAEGRAEGRAERLRHRIARGYYRGFDAAASRS